MFGKLSKKLLFLKRGFLIKIPKGLNVNNSG